MTQSIPASQLVNSVPSVLAAGGNPLSLNAVFLTTDDSIPIGTAMPFGSVTAVEDWFGPNAPESILAGQYFQGYSLASVLPSTLWFYQYNPAAVAGYLRGGALTNVSLTELQGFSGTLTIEIDGETVVSAAINLSSATSYTNAAALITTGLQTVGGIFSGTGQQTLGVLDITATATGELHVGDTVTGAGVFGGTATILSFGTYTTLAGTGTVNVSTSGSAGPGAVDVSSTAVCSFDSLRDAFVITSGTTGATSSVAYPTTDTFATDLLLTAATGAVLSAGAAAATPAGTMNGVVNATQNWATFTNVTDPDDGAPGGAIKLEFADWVSGQSPAGQERFAYVAWDSDLTPSTEANDSSSFVAAVTAAQLNGVVPIWDQTQGLKAAFFCGMVASTNFNAPGGRIAYDGKGAAGLTADVTSLTAEQNLLSNGYNFYGAYGSANQTFLEFQPGSMPGQWKWADPYINQIWLNNAFQLALLVYKQQQNQVPYNQQGNNGIRGAMFPTVQQALSNGVIQAGVMLSASQAQAVITATGNPNAATTLQNVGWLLFIGTASPTVRGNRGSPPITFYYTDGGSIRTLSFNSVDVE